MKTILLPLAWLLASGSLLLAQPTNLPPGGIVARAIRALPAPAAVAEEIEENLSKTNFAGLGRNASWAVERSIQPAPGGARAEFGLQKTFFPLDVKAGGPVVLTAPDARRLSFRATFLALHDLASDQSLLIAEVTNRTGVILGANEVIYTNAFDTLQADIRYRYTAYSLEQDIILHEHPTLPKEFAPETTRLEIWTEWFDSVPESKTAHAIDLRANDPSGLLAPSLIEDEGLDFGAMKIVSGRAFSSTAQDESTPVGKSWVRVDGRDWLVETVDYLAVKPNLDLLPGSRRAGSSSQPKSRREALIRSLARTTTPLPPPAGKMLLAQSRAARSAEFVMDFVIVSSVPTPADIVSWWPASTGTNAYDAITNNNHGTLQYSATNGVGKVGQAFSFNGTYARVRVPDSASLHFTNALTIETWVYPTNTSTYRDIVSKWDAVGGANQRSYDLSLYPGGQFYLLVSPGGTDTGATYVLSTNTVPLNQWTHLAGTYDGSTLTLYFNGVLDGSPGAYGNGIYPGTNALGIGGTIGGGSGTTIVSPFMGLIDEPSLYHRALGASEIAAIYNAGAAGKLNPKCVVAPTNLVAWWPGDGNGYDLARTNFATVNGAIYASAVVGQGFSFDGVNDGVTAAHQQDLNLGANDDVTIETWILPLTNSSASYGVTSIAGKRYAPNLTTAIGYELFLAYGVPGFQIASATGLGNFFATGDLRGSGYHHLVVTLDRDATAGGVFYVDGVALGTFNPTVVSGSLSNAEPFRIGVHPLSSFNGWYKGIVDEVSVYRRALTSTEVTVLYTAGSAGKCKTDSDGDGLTDLQEQFLGTNPNDSDSDHDGLADGDEVFVHHSDPLSPDNDGDGVPDWIELAQGRNPNSPSLPGAAWDSGNATRLQIHTPLK